jgi:putative Mg2+ transporter-C (MgtC) family protein
MLVTAYESHWMHVAGDLVKLDPTRMAQGIMTGIGFLGAGVIVREGLSVRGLTTAASIWMTAAIGILAGIGFYFPLIVSVAITIGVLSVFRVIEEKMPTLAYFHFDLKLARAVGMNEAQLRELVEKHGFSIANFSYRMDVEAGVRRHSMVTRSPDKARRWSIPSRCWNSGFPRPATERLIIRPQFARVPPRSRRAPRRLTAADPCRPL